MDAYELGKQGPLKINPTMITPICKYHFANPIWTDQKVVSKIGIVHLQRIYSKPELSLEKSLMPSPSAHTKYFCLEQN